MNSILLSGYVNLFIHSARKDIQKDIVVASNFAVMNKAAINIRVQFFVCGHKFSVHLG